jgi:outer membrane receptor protein involved in Fe transport
MRLIKTFLLTATAFAACQVIAQTAPAAAPAGGDKTAADNGALETLVVNARRLDERLIDVPLSIRALSAKDMQDRAITSITELSLFTPGLSYSPDFGRTAERPVIRGISALRQEAPQPVSVFIDGIFMRDGTLGLALDDAQRVEVIKGPQSALYGRSTYAGAINYITAKPSQTVKGTVSVSRASAGEDTLFGAVSFPVLPEVLSARLKVKDYSYGGQYTNSQTGNKIGYEHSSAGGMQLFFTPNQDFDALLSMDSSRDRDGLFAATLRTIPTQASGAVASLNGSTNIANGAVCNGRTVNIVGNNAAGLPDASVPASLSTKLNGWPCGASVFTGTTLIRNEKDLANYVDPKTGQAYGDIAGLDRQIDRTSLTMNKYFSNGYTLTSQTAYTRQRANVGADQSYNNTQFVPSYLGGSSWTSYDRDTLNYYSQEVRLSSAEKGPLTWMVGGFLYQEDGDGQTGNGVIAKDSSGKVIIAPLGLTPKSASHVHNEAFFGRVQYELTNAIRVSAEGRSSSERVQVGGTALGVASYSFGTCVVGQVCYINGDKTFKDFAPRFTVDYKASKDMMFYAQNAKGSKSGGFNTTPGLPDSVFSYSGEKINSTEVGFKTVLNGGKIGFNIAAFKNDIDGLQLSNLSTVTSPFTGQPATTTIVNNVGKALTQGLEFDLSMRTTDWLTLAANYAYTDAKVVEGTEITNGTVFGGNMSAAGFTLPRTPKHSAAGSAAVDFPIAGTDKRAFGRIDVVYQSRRYAEIQNMIWADPFTHVNLSAGVRAKGWKANLWVKNATNDATSLNGFRYVDPSTYRRTAVDFLPRLRQIGATVSYDI